MKRTQPRLATFGFAAALSAHALAAGAIQESRAEIDVAKARILSVVEPRLAGDTSTGPQSQAPDDKAVPVQSGTKNELTEAVARLIKKGEYSAIDGLGLGAAPALRALAETAKIEDLIQAHPATSPLLYLAEIDPVGTLDYFASLLNGDITRFKALAFVSPGGLIDAATRMEENDRKLGSTKQLFERACLDDRLSLPLRVRLGAAAQRLGISTPGTEELLLGHVELWTKTGGSTKNLATLYIKGKGLPPDDVAPNIAEILWGHSLEVDEALSRNQDPEVRVSFARRMMNQQAPGADPATVHRLPLLVNRALEETSRVRPEYFRAVEHVLRRSSSTPWLSPDLLARLIDGSEAEAALSPNLVEAVIYQIDRAMHPVDAVTEAQWAALIRAAAGNSSRRVKDRYLYELKKHAQYSPAAIAYGTALATMEGLPQEYFAGKVNDSDVMSPEEKARTRLRLVQLLGAENNVAQQLLDEDRPFSFVPASDLRNALLFYGNEGAGYTKTAVADADHWGLNHRQVLRELCADKDLPWRSRAVAAVGLLSTNHVSDGALASRVLIDEAATKEQLTAARGLITARTRYMNLQGSWAEYVARILKAAGTRPDVLSTLPYSGLVRSSTRDQRERIVRGAAAIAGEEEARSILMSLADLLAKWMSSDASLCSNGLILKLIDFAPWGRGNDEAHDLALSRPEIRGQVMEVLLEAVRGSGDLEDVVSSILRVADDEEMNALIQAVTDSSQTSLLQFLEERLASMSRLRAAQRAWSSASTAAPTKEAAIEKVLGMLASKDEDVRVEVILGLSTLGAVEALPTLIEIVGSGTTREKAAAKESLTLLREMAKRRVLEQARGSAPVGK